MFWLFIYSSLGICCRLLSLDTVKFSSDLVWPFLCSFVLSAFTRGCTWQSVVGSGLWCLCRAVMSFCDAHSLHSQGRGLLLTLYNGPRLHLQCMPMPSYGSTLYLVSVFFRTCSQVVKVCAVQNGNTGSLYYQGIEALNFHNFSHPLQRLTNERRGICRI